MNRKDPFVTAYTPPTEFPLNGVVDQLKAKDIPAAFVNWYQLKNIEEPEDFPGTHNKDAWLDVFASFMNDMIEWPKDLSEAIEEDEKAGRQP